MVAKKRVVEKNLWSKPTKVSINKILDQDVFETVKHVIFSFQGTFLEPCLGSVPKDEYVYTNFVAKDDGTQTRKAKIVEEAENIDNEFLTEKEKKGYTGFWEDVNGIFFYNYWIIGNIKANLETLQNNKVINKIWKYKHFVDKAARVFPRRIYFISDLEYEDDPGKLGKDGKIIGIVPNRLQEANGQIEDKKGLFRPKNAQYSIERPLRAETRMGERTTVVKSDIVNAGTKFDFHIKLIYNDKGLTPEVVIRALKLGEIYGLGQWRGSGGYGSYKIELMDVCQV